MEKNDIIRIKKTKRKSIMDKKDIIRIKKLIEATTFFMKKEII
jgi:hypothetical protein